jgi:hypothetical protein
MGYTIYKEPGVFDLEILETIPASTECRLQGFAFRFTTQGIEQSVQACQIGIGKPSGIGIVHTLRTKPIQRGNVIGWRIVVHREV